MKKLLLNSILLLSFPVFAQVGIGTDSPKAQLDIISYNPSNPEAIDGILIPRLKKFPGTSPGTDQHGMLVFLNADIQGYDAGFYYWDSQNNKWIQLGGSAAGDFYKPGTTTSAGNIQEPVYRQGNIGIGTEEITSKLQISLHSPADAAIKKGLEVDNNNATVDNLTTYGIINNNRSATNGTKYGLKNNVGGLGSGVHYGIFTETYQNTGTNDIYGIFNRVGRTFGAKSDNFGIYSQIGTTQGQGNIYGIYSVAQGDHNARVYAGYFVGRVGIGLSPQQEYILPAIRGANEQFLTLDSSGNLNWTFNNIRNYSSTTSAIGAYQIQDDVYSLRINDAVSSIIIPPANLHKGRILTLIAWKGTKTKPFIFSGNDDIYDVVTDSSLASISGSQTMTIQSAGNRWVLLNIRKAP
jgi:hypothetical protein